MHLHGNLKIKQEQFRTKTKRIRAMFFSDFITYVHCNVLKEQDVLCEVFFQRDFLKDISKRANNLMGHGHDFF